MQVDGINAYRIRLVAELDRVELVRSGFESFLEDLGVGVEDVEFWKLILTEAVTNAIKHGCGNDPGKDVTVA